MKHSTAILAPNGNVGVAILRHLLPEHQAGKIKLTLLHRPGGPPKNLPPGCDVEVREIDLEGPPEKVQQAVRGLNSLVSALPIPVLHLQIPLVRALSNTPGFVTFIPARFSIPVTDDDYPFLPLMKHIRETEEVAAELGVGITSVWAGMFDTSFVLGPLGTSPRDNKVVANSNHMKNSLPITTLDHLGMAVADLLVREPASIANKAFSAVTFQPSGQDMMDAFTMLHQGSDKPTTTRVPHTPEAQEELMRDVLGPGSFMGIYFRHWDRGDLDFPRPIAPPQNAGSFESRLRRLLE